MDRGPVYSSFGPLKVVPGSTNFTVHCYIQWYGLGPSGDFYVSFRASINNQISTLDPEIAKVLVPSINAGAYVYVSWSGIFPESIPINTYYVGWLIDVDNDVGEDVPGELNNAVYETSYELEVVIAAELYDRGLAYSGFTPTVVTPTVTPFNIWCDIENVGVAPSGPFNVSFRASYNPTISTLDFEIAKVTVPSIMNGSYADVSWTGMFPYMPFSGYFVGWLIDSDYDVDEGDEEDVGLAADYINVVNKSDLADRGPSYSGMSETTVEPGVTAFSVFADIENIGIKASETCNVSFYASLDTNITTSDYYLGYDAVIPILNGTYFDATWAGIFPNMTDGSYYIGWIIDVNDDVDEGNEENNQAYILTQLIVETPTPVSGGIPGYDLFLIIGFLASMSVLIIISKRKKNRL